MHRPTAFVVCALALAACSKGGGPIEVKSTPEFSGTYDGSKAVAWLYPDGTLDQVYIAKDCPQISCEQMANWNYDGLKKACPKGILLQLDLQKPKAGKGKIKAGLLKFPSTTTSLPDVDADIKTLSGKEIAGTLSMATPDGSAVKGNFDAKVCNPK